MIHKVNRPPALTLVSSSKRTENDPGASSGSGLFYDGPPEKDSPPEKITTTPESNSVEKREHLSVVTRVEQAGMTEVVKDLYENKSESHSINQAGLTLKYNADNGPAKGMLLNKKA